LQWEPGWSRAVRAPAPVADPDVGRLRSFIARLPECENTDERDLALVEMKEEVKDLLTRRPGFQRHWLLKLDQINKRFVSTEGGIPRPVQSSD
jgi:hypothetical protein